jgi:hypothetical protein
MDSNTRPVNGPPRFGCGGPRHASDVVDAPDIMRTNPGAGSRFRLKRLRSGKGAFEDPASLCAGKVGHSPGALEPRLEALGQIAARSLAHRAGHAEGAAEQLLLGAERAQPFVVGARQVGADRHIGIGWRAAPFGAARDIVTPFCSVIDTPSPTGTERLKVVPIMLSWPGSTRVSIDWSQPSVDAIPGAFMVAQATPVD